MLVGALVAVRISKRLVRAVLRRLRRLDQQAHESGAA